MSRLIDGLAEARAGRGRIILLSGEPGIGKTRLAEEFADLVLAEGGRVLWGRCWEGGGAPAYLPWIQALRSCLRRTGDGDPLAHLGRSAPYIASLVPEIRDRLPETRLPARLQDEDERFALFDAVREFLFALAEERVHLVVLDDLHAADPGSLLLLKFLADQARRASLLLLGIYREVEARFAPRVEGLLSEIGREATRLSLNGLGVADVSRIITQVANRAVNAPLTEAIHRHTEGNPLFVDETVRLLAAEGRLEETDASQTLRVPSAVRGTISRRLEHLSAEARAVLTLAAVIGRDFDTALLAEVAGTEPLVLTDLLGEATHAGVVATGAGAFGRGSFAHALFRETLHEEAEPRRRAVLHERVAEALERRPRAEVEARLSELAHHWYEARAVSGGPGRWVDYAIRAADTAMALHGYEDAVVLYSRAIGEVRQEDDRLGDLLLSLGEAQWRAGALDDARSTFLRAAGIARALGSAHRLARAALGYASGVTVYALRQFDETISTLLAEADAALGNEESPIRVRVLARLALEKLWIEDVRSREEVSRRALEIAERLGDARVLGWALYASCHAMWSPDGVEERLALIGRLLKIAAEIGDDEMSFLGHHMRFRTRMHLGEVREAEMELATCAQLAERLQVRLYREQALACSLIRPLYFSGDLNQATKVIEEAATLPSPSQDLLGQMGVATLWVRLFRGDTGTFAAGFQGLRDRYPHTTRLVGAFMGWALLEAGEIEAGRLEFEAVLRGGDLPRNDLWIAGMHSLALACARLGDRGAAVGLRDELAPYAGRVTSFAMASSMGATAHPLACLSAVLEEWDEAFHLFDLAFQTNLSVHRTMAAVVLRDKAAALLTRNEPGDASQALEVAEQALEMMRRMGMDGWIPSTEATASRARGAAGAFLRRTGEEWLLEFGGEHHRLKDAKGLHYLVRLLGSPHEEVHVLDLVAGAAGSGRAPTRAELAELGLRATHLAETGPVLDAEAKAAYRARVAELEEEREEALRWNDGERAAAVESEIHALTGELAGAVGPGGRDRRASPEAERARVNVSRSVKAAIGQISQVCPAAGRHLAGAVRTGWYCSYAPDPSKRLSWTL